MKKLIGAAALLVVAMGAGCADTQKKTDGWQGGKTLVAYYSATGTTKAVSEKIAAFLDADLFVIEPSEGTRAATLTGRTNKAACASSTTSFSEARRTERRPPRT